MSRTIFALSLLLLELVVFSWSESTTSAPLTSSSPGRIALVTPGAGEEDEDEPESQGEVPVAGSKKSSK